MSDLTVLYFTLQRHPLTGIYHTIGGHSCAGIDAPRAVAVCGALPGLGSWAPVPLPVDLTRLCPACRAGVRALLAPPPAPRPRRMKGPVA